MNIMKLSFELLSFFQTQLTLLKFFKRMFRGKACRHCNSLHSTIPMCLYVSLGDVIFVLSSLYYLFTCSPQEDFFCYFLLFFYNSSK